MSENTVNQDAEGDAWYLDQSINISLPADMNDDELLKALGDNRETLDSLKQDYWNAKKVKSIDDRENRMLRHEMKRVVNAIETIKNKLVLRALRFPLSQWDNEHPNAACRRLDSENISGNIFASSRCAVIFALLAVGAAIVVCRIVF